MLEPWFDTKYDWLPGTVLGCAAGLWGAAADHLAARGKGRRFILWSAAVVLVPVSVVLLTLGAVAYTSGQPRPIWYGLGFPGALGLAATAVCVPILLARHGRGADYQRLKDAEADGRPD